MQCALALYLTGATKKQILEIQKESKYKMRRENHWQPPLEPMLLSLYDHMKYHFEACVNRIWATTRIFEFDVEYFLMEIYCTDCKRDNFLPDILIHNFGGSSSVARMRARERQRYIKGEERRRRTKERLGKRESLKETRERQ